MRSWRKAGDIFPGDCTFIVYVGLRHRCRRKDTSNREQVRFLCYGNGSAADFQCEPYIAACSFAAEIRMPARGSTVQCQSLVCYDPGTPHIFCRQLCHSAKGLQSFVFREFVFPVSVCVKRYVFADADHLREFLLCGDGTDPEPGSAREDTAYADAGASVYCPADIHRRIVQDTA